MSQHSNLHTTNTPPVKLFRNTLKHSMALLMSVTQIVNHTMIGGGVVQGFVNGDVTATVRTSYTSLYVQCLVNGAWTSFGLQKV